MIFSHKMVVPTVQHSLISYGSETWVINQEWMP